MTAPALTAQQVYRAKEAAAILGVSKTTFYTIRWFWDKKVRISAGAVGYLASDIALYQSLRRGA